jgi:oligopeptide transport system substrate-binding protein
VTGSVRVLDPAAAKTPAEGSILNAILDPLVRLDPSGHAVPALAKNWKVSADGRTVTFHLRPAGVWTNGDPVTAADFEYAWKRAAAPRFAKLNAPLFADIVGAERYTTCRENCAPLQEGIAIEALDDVTLEVTLERAMPWFPQRVAHWAFLPVHEPTIAEHKRRWSLPENIVSNGAFELVEWRPRAGLALERWDQWRRAGSVDPARIEGSMTNDEASALVDFQDGRVDACLPGRCTPENAERELAAAPEFAAFPAPVTTYLGVNLERLGDVDLRRAIAIGLDRRAIVARAAPGIATEATTLVPTGLPGFDATAQTYLTVTPKRGKARRLVRESEAPKRLILAYESADAELAERVQTQLAKIGLEAETDERPREGLAAADLFLADVTAEDPEALDVLERWTCDGDAGFCNPPFDRLAREARRTVDDDERYALERELEEALTSKKGAFPAIPLYSSMYSLLRSSTVEGLDANLLELVDLPAVSVAE